MDYGLSVVNEVTCNRRKKSLGQQGKGLSVVVPRQNVVHLQNE